MTLRRLTLRKRRRLTPQRERPGLRVHRPAAISMVPESKVGQTQRVRRPAAEAAAAAQEATRKRRKYLRRRPLHEKEKGKRAIA